ncbi:MAG TPA: hypothetical protein VLV86_24640 [Vicinamibacterales bacterium]|nr:hypothetical protein [Vicinamibacterales bacterium]
MSLDYTAGKLEVAIHNLATSRDDLRQRLHSAWATCHTLISDEDFPTADLAGRWQILVAEMRSAVPADEEGSTRETLAGASDEDVDRWADEFVDIALETIKIEGQSENE